MSGFWSSHQGIYSSSSTQLFRKRSQASENNLLDRFGWVVGNISFNEPHNTRPAGGSHPRILLVGVGSVSPNPVTRSPSSTATHSFGAIKASCCTPTAKALLDWASSRLLFHSETPARRFPDAWVWPKSSKVLAISHKAKAEGAATRKVVEAFHCVQLVNTCFFRRRVSAHHLGWIQSGWGGLISFLQLSRHIVGLQSQCPRSSVPTLHLPQTMGPAQEKLALAWATPRRKQRSRAGPSTPPRTLPTRTTSRMSPGEVGAPPLPA